VGGARRSEILRVLRGAENDFVSSAHLGELFAVSRAAIWKQIAQLREEGYAIEAVPSRGYRLLAVPDRFDAEELRRGLQSRVVGRQIHCFAEVDSTNVRAAQLAEQGAEEGSVVLAEAQSAGKGRLGRRWESPPGVNLYLSVILRPHILPRQAPLLTFLSSLAVARTIEAESGLRPTVKWPNDVLLHGRKVAGLLNEMNAETERINYVILGIGVNLNMQREAFPAELRYPATSLALELGRPIDRSRFCRRLCAELDRLYGEYAAAGEEAILNGWLAYFDLIGKVVTVSAPDRTLDGVVAGLAPDGALLLRRDDGGVERILAGDVRPREND